MHVCIVGGGAALTAPVAEHFERRGDKVSKVYSKRGPCGLPKSVAEIDEPIDVLVTMPGAVCNALLTDPTVAEADFWEPVIDANLTAVFRALRYGLPKMPDGGNVVVVGSVVGSTGGYGCANYAAAKAGLVGLVRAAANEVATRGVCVNLLELGYVECGMGARLESKVREKILPTIPLKRFARPEEVVDAIDFLAKIRYATGNIFVLAGGFATD